MRFWGVQRFHFLQLYMNNRFLQPPEDGLLRGDCQYKMILWNWPKKTWMSYYVLNSWRVAAIAVDLPHSYLLALHQNVLKASAAEGEILEIIRHIFFQRQVCISNKCARDHFSSKFCLLFNPLSPKSDQHEISFYNINALENRVVLKIEYMNQGKWV